jgi:hypothetical protein
MTTITVILSICLNLLIVLFTKGYKIEAQCCAILPHSTITAPFNVAKEHMSVRQEFKVTAAVKDMKALPRWL